MNRIVVTLALPLLLVTTPALHAQSAVDERAAIETVSALDAALDGKDWERARRLLLEEVTFEQPGNEPTSLASDALVGEWRESLHREKTSFHLRGGEVVVFDGADSVVVSSKVRIQLHVPNVPGDDHYEVSRDYAHELDRTEDGWRIRRLSFVTHMESGNPAVLAHRLPPPPEPAAEPQATADAPPEEEEKGGKSDGKEEAAPDATAGTDDGGASAEKPSAESGDGGAEASSGG